MNPVKILYVDEYDLVLQTVQHMLEIEGWSVETCRDGLEALVRIKSSERYDLFLFNESLPGIKGIELVRHARSLAHRRRTPVIIFASTDCEQQAIEAGADAVIRKPDDIEVLTHTVAVCLRGKEYDPSPKQTSPTVNRRASFKPQLKASVIT